jgi:thiol-disulfide isomerase/thioredoxin
LIQAFDSLALLQKGLPFTDYRNFKRQLTTDYVRQNPSSVISLKLLDDYFYKDGAANDTLYFSLFSMLHPSLQQSFLGRRIGAEAAQRSATAVGQKAPMMVLTDTANLKQPLYRSGQYTLINFWASWCVPCRKEHPSLIRLYNQYKDKGFTITGVSLDRSRSAWLAAIKKEGLVWTQVGDRQAFESKVVKQYGVQVVPTSYLVDPYGVIIDRNITVDALAQRLAEVFQN